MGCANCRLENCNNDNDDEDETKADPPHAAATVATTKELMESEKKDEKSTAFGKTDFGSGDKVVQDSSSVPVEQTEEPARVNVLRNNDRDARPSEIKDDIRDLIKCRREAHSKKTRQDVTSKSKAIEIVVKRSFLHHPLHPSIPYGLDEEMEGIRRHIWDLVFAHVNDLNTIENLREICSLFRDLIEGKYVGAMLPHVIGLCLEKKFIPWESSRTGKSTWVKTLQDLRVLSKTTKNSVDMQFNRGMLVGVGEWVWFHMSPHHRNFCTEEWKIPTLTLGALDVEQARLQRTLDFLKSRTFSVLNCPIQALIFDETREDRLDIDLQDLRIAFQKCLEKIGCRIISFRYKTKEDPSNTYNNLRRWLGHMPYLEELMVELEFTGRRATISPENVDPFLTCTRLRRFAEGPQGFGYPFISKLLMANPSIQEVLLAQMPSSELEMNSVNQALNTLHLTKFYCTSKLTISFSDFNFQWIQTLTSLVILDKGALVSPLDKISSERVFEIISKFKNLQTLGLMSPRIRDTGGYLDLPKLLILFWKVFPSFTNLEFMKPLSDLKWLYLDLMSCPLHLQTKDGVMHLLRKHHIPALFPALEEIKVRSQGTTGYKTVWKPSESELP